MNTWPGNGIIKRTKQISAFNGVSFLPVDTPMQIQEQGPEGDPSEFNCKVTLWKDINGTPSKLASVNFTHNELTPLFSNLVHKYAEFTDTGSNEADIASTDTYLNWDLDLSGNGNDYYGIVVETRGNFEVGHSGGGSSRIAGAGSAVFALQIMDP